ncbi:MAG: asparagine synthase (glutamine-hydrolyzing) [Candidatus Omnitrophica bacterium]|nr:asparagine synthase (glutamine-hydrolyzing) [Candidatus Omnitrophota bacterium]
MCGIAGIIDFKGRGIESEKLQAMTECVSHRGPDDTGYYKDKFVGLGFKRLSIIDLETGHQPMSNEDGSIFVVANGEIYNFDELRSILRSRNHSFKTTSDTEVIVHAYEEWGKACVEKFNGMFAFVVYDIKNRSVFLVRDRLGIKPLYYSFINGLVLFASEMKSILNYPHFPRSANLSAISSYLTFRYPQGVRTVFSGIKRLAPGHVMEVTTSGTEIRQYWQIPFHDRKEDRGEKFYLQEIKRLLSLAVKRRMISDVPLGAFLSGGLDSSIVVVLMSQFSNKAVKAFSIGFAEEGYNEFDFSKRVSDIYDAEYYPILLSKIDYMNMLPKMIRQKDAPLSIPHEVALYQLCVELKKHVTVVISGEGADELFGGYGRVQRSPMDFKKISFVNNYVPSFMRKQLFKLLGAGLQAGKWKAINSHMDHFFSVYNWIPFEEKWSLFTDELNHQLNFDEQEINEWRSDFEYVQRGDPYDRILYMFEKRHLLCLLDRLDSMSMAAAVEARVPFVDHELIEFVSTIPSHYKLKWRSPLHRFRALFANSFETSEKFDESKAILRKFAKEILPPEITSRKKLGFPVPLDSWIKQGLIKQAKDILLDERSCRRGIFRKDRIEKLLNNQQNLDYDFWGKKIWMLMNVELWFREFIDSQGDKGGYTYQ